jgi:LPXTG-motif cell wall-anchored protein
MKKTNIFYWIFTGLLCALMLFSAVGGLMGGKDSVAMMQHIGYGPHVLAFISVAKILGVIALLVPGFPRLKEWAYAGFTIDLAGAMYSFIAVGDPASSWMFIIIGFLLIAGSYIFYHKKKKGL